jgi:hypothetical protein
MSTVKAPPTASPWTEAKRAKAEAESKYMKIDKPGQLLLTGALKMWKESPNFIYLPSLRIAGESEVQDASGTTLYPVFNNLTNVLKLSPEQAGKYINEAYSVESVVGDAKAPYELDKVNGRLASQFKAELEKRETTKKSVVKKVNTISINDINAIGKSIKDATVVPKKSVAPKTTKSGGSHKVPLIKKMLKLSAEKVLDVSGLGLNKGTKNISPPKSANNTKYCVNVQLYDEENKQNVSKGLCSNNPESLKIALEQLYPGEANTVNTYLTSWQTIKAKAGIPKVVTGPVIPTVPVVTTVVNGAIPVPVFGNGIASPVVQTMESMFKKV